ncbi:hypothetical protein [Sulfitobacter sp. SH24]|uniref:hypothetical protein n=1 Tax=Sulfitobacter sp. SH24 TaxID=3421173 RepID=UPI003F4FCD31
MWVLPPLSIDPAKVIATNIADSPLPVWASGSYGLGAEVQFEKWVYQSLIPSNDKALTDATAWLKTAPVNDYRPFDHSNALQAERVDSITFTIQPGSRVDTVGFIALDATEVTVTINVPGEVTPAYHMTKKTLRSENRGSWSKWLFGPRVYQREIVFANLPRYKDAANATIDITINKPNDTAKVGEILVGRVWQIGTTSYGTEARINNYSIDEVDEHGTSRTLRRRAGRTVNFVFTHLTGRIGYTLDQFEQLTATKMLFMAGADLDRFGTTIFGTFQNLEPPIEGPKVSKGELEVRSVIS